MQPTEFRFLVYFFPIVTCHTYFYFILIFFYFYYCILFFHFGLARIPASLLPPSLIHCSAADSFLRDTAKSCRPGGRSEPPLRAIRDASDAFLFFNCRKENNKCLGNRHRMGDRAGELVRPADPLDYMRPIFDTFMYRYSLIR